MIQHHSVFAHFPVYTFVDENGWYRHWNGTIQRKYYDQSVIPNTVSESTRPQKTNYLAEREFGRQNLPPPPMHPVGKESSARHLPAFDEEYFEWIDLLESIVLADESFTMAELGAGYGRWSVFAASAHRALSGNKPFHLVLVEAEPTHFRWIETHMKDNGIDPAQHRLIEAAVSDRPGWVEFETGFSDHWYGQRIREKLRLKQVMKRTLSRLFKNENPAIKPEFKRVRAVTLGEVLEGIKKVDLLDLDIQGSEMSVLSTGVSSLQDKVKRVHVATHSRDIDAQLHELFQKMNWRLIHAYSYQSESDTPYGRIRFGDGLQSWVNPKFDK